MELALVELTECRKRWIETAKRLVCKQPQAVGIVRSDQRDNMRNEVKPMSDAAARIIEQLQAQNDLRMEAATDIANAVSARIDAEHKLEEAQIAEKLAFTAALKRGWTQAELNKLSAKPRRRNKKDAGTRVEEPTQ